MSQKRYIYATLLSTPGYLQGIKVLYKSLCKYGKLRYPFVCFCSQGLPEHCIEELKWYGIECIRLSSYALEDSTFQEMKSLYSSSKVSHWAYTFDKLFLFGMEQYDKIVFLDSDMMVLNDINELFDKPNMSAVQAGRFKYPDWVRLNSGCMVFTPNKDTEKGLFDSILPAINERASQGLECGDQDVINYYFNNWPGQENLHLPQSYNVFFSWLPEYIERYGKSVDIVHFIGGGKPWFYKGSYKEMLYLIGLMRYQQSSAWTYLRYKMLLCKINFTDFLWRHGVLKRKG